MGSFEHNTGYTAVTPNYRHCYRSKFNISTSFQLDSLKCNTCMSGEHMVIGREVVGGGRDLAPVVFVLTDQNFPPVLPVNGDGNCFKIIAVEDATLHELVGVLLEATRGFRVPAGSVVLLTSASYLAYVGVVAYTAEFCRCPAPPPGRLWGGPRGYTRTWCSHPKC
jgi:hypothetical protein